MARHYFFIIKKCDKLDCSIYHPSHCSQEDFELLYRLPDPVPGNDLHYKSFEELYGAQTIENHRLSFVNAKAKMKKSEIKTTKTKHTMPFCPSAVHAKNVGITVNYTECEKPRLLFNAKKLFKKDKITLREFLDMIFYTCGMSFHGTCDLTMTVSPKHDMENNISDKIND